MLHPASSLLHPTLINEHVSHYFGKDTPKGVMMWEVDFKRSRSLRQRTHRYTWTLKNTDVDLHKLERKDMHFIQTHTPNKPSNTQRWLPQINLPAISCQTDGETNRGRERERERESERERERAKERERERERDGSREENTTFSSWLIFPISSRHDRNLLQLKHHSGDRQCVCESVCVYAEMMVVFYWVENWIKLVLSYSLFSSSPPSLHLLLLLLLLLFFISLNFFFLSFYSKTALPRTRHRVYSHACSSLWLQWMLASASKYNVDYFLLTCCMVTFETLLFPKCV